MLLAVCLLLVGYTYANPLAGMVLYSISLSFGPVVRSAGLLLKDLFENNDPQAMITSIPLLVPFPWIGTALGLYKCASNIGTRGQPFCCDSNHKQF